MPFPPPRFQSSTSTHVMPARIPPLTRRAFLGRLAAVGAPALLVACGGDGAGESDLPPVVDASTCRGYDPESVALRRTLGYEDRSVVPGQYCTNCRFYVAPASSGDRCGGCTLIPGLGESGQGPVSPGGYCRSWAAVPA